MKKGTIILLVVLAGIVLWGVSAYNGLVNKEEKMEASWGNVQTSYQRRADLIPNLVETVKGYATHEKSTLEGVIEARSNAMQMKLELKDLTEENLKKYQELQGNVGSALGRLMAIRESYPDLKANTNFLNLQDELAGTENRIAVARDRFNEGARDYNSSLRRFPTTIIASIFGFEKKPYFEADAAAQTAPSVKF